MAIPSPVIKDIIKILKKQRKVWVLVPAVALALYVLSGFYVIVPGDVGVVRHFGRVRESAVAPGIHYRVPWPVDRLTRVSTCTIRRMSIGFKFRDAQAGIPPLSMDTQFLTGDSNIIGMKLVLQYVVEDPVKYLFAVEDADWLVRKAGEAAVLKKMVGMSVDDVLTTGKHDIQVFVKDSVQKMLNEYCSGLMIIGATLQDASPPRDVASAFRDVASAREDRQKKINEAHGKRNEILPRARGEAKITVVSAEAEKAARVERAKGDTDRFLALCAEYEKAPVVTTERIYREKMEEILSKVKVYVVGKRGGSPSPVKLRLIKKAEGK